MLRMALLGPPGAGKGTQAARISRRTGLPVLSTGQVLAEHIAAGTRLGEQARACVEHGELVPDELVIAMVRERLSQWDCADGFVLDGFPRTLAQAEALDRVLAERGERLDVVVELTIDECEVLARIRKRARSQHRRDDTEETARRRMQVFADRSGSLRDYYRRQGLLTVVDGSGSRDAVSARVDAALAELTSRPGSDTGR